MSKAIDTIRKSPVFAILDETDTYPYSLSRKCNGIAVNSTGSVDVVIDLNTDNALTITIPAGETYEADFQDFDEIDVTAGDTYFIEVRAF